MSPRFIGPYQILRRVGPVAYQLALPPSLFELHDIFHVSQLKKYIHDPSQTLHHDSIQLKSNLTFKPVPSRIVDRSLKTLRKKAISLVKVVWEGMSPEDATWELESEILEKYPHLFY